MTTSEVRFAPLAELSAKQWHDLAKLRADVFIVEQNCPYPDLDGRDLEPGTVHGWIEVDGQIGGVLRILRDPDAMRIGRVATAPDCRGRGIAADLVRAAVARCGESTVVLDAQSHLKHWYAGLGFAQSGPEFIEDGIRHVPMRRFAVRDVDAR